MAGPMRAGIQLAAKFEEAFHKGDLDFVRRTLRDMEPAWMHPDTVVVLLSNIRQGCEALGLGEEYHRVREKALRVLGTRWPEEDALEAHGVF